MPFVQIVDIQTGEPLGPGTAGEICVKSPAPMIGYVNNRQATEATIDSYGWLHTGNTTMSEIFDNRAHSYDTLSLGLCCVD